MVKRSLRRGLKLMVRLDGSRIFPGRLTVEWFDLPRNEV